MPTHRKHELLSDNTELELVQQDWKGSKFAEILDDHVYSFSTVHLRNEKGVFKTIGPLSLDI